MAIVVPIYMYHQVAPRTAPGYEPYLYVTPETFSRQVIELKKQGFRLVTLAQAWLHIMEEKPLPKLAVLTFDDVAMNFVQYVLPILVREKVPATVFAIGSMIGRQLHNETDNLNSPLVPLDGRELRVLSDAGIEVGSHTLSHRELHRLNNDELVHELVDSRKMIEDITGLPCPALCYPRGRFSPRVCCAADAAGYQFACTTMRGNAHDPADRFILSRIRATEKRLGFKLRYTTTTFYDWWNRKRRERNRIRFTEEDPFRDPGVSDECGIVPHRGFGVKK